MKSQPNEEQTTSLKSIKNKWEIKNNAIEIQKEIHSSQFTCVYIGVLKKTNTVVAVKEFIQTGTDESYQDFLNEISIISKLDHFAITPFVGAIFSPKYSIITQFMSGGSLYSRLHSKIASSKLTSTKLSIISLGIAYGMAYLHSKNIVHRDLKSLNILLDANDCPNISDFGVATIQQNETLTGGAGTAQWMAPEVLSSKPYDQKVDVYSYAMILWEMFTTHIPFNGMTQLEVAVAVCKQKMRPKIPLNCPKNLRRLITTCWDADPNKRPEFVRIVNALESCSITFPGTDIRQLKSYIEQFSPSKLISIVPDQGSVSESILLRTVDANTIEHLINDLKRSTEHISTLIQIAGNPSFLTQISHSPLIIEYLSQHLKNCHSSEITNLIKLLSILLQNPQLRASFFQLHCEESILFVLTETVTSLIPSLLTVIRYIVEEGKCQLNDQQLDRISSYLLCVDLNVRQAAIDLLLLIFEKREVVVTSISDFAVVIENLLINVYPEMTNFSFLHSIVTLLFYFSELLENAKQQIIHLNGTDKIIGLLTVENEKVVSISLDLLLNLCQSKELRAQTSQTFIDEFSTFLNTNPIILNQSNKLFKLTNLYLNEESTYDNIAVYDDFIPVFITKCIDIPNDTSFLVDSLSIIERLVRNNQTSKLFVNYFESLIGHFRPPLIDSVVRHISRIISLLLSQLKEIQTEILKYKTELSNVASFAFYEENETTLSVLSLFGVLTNLTTTQSLCNELNIPNLIITFLSSKNDKIIQMTIRVLITISSVSSGNEMIGLSSAIRPLFLLCSNKVNLKKFGKEALCCVSNLIRYGKGWTYCLEFLDQLFELYDDDELSKIVILITYRIFNEASYSIANNEECSIFSNQKLINEFIDRTRDKLIGVNNDILIGIILVFSKTEPTRNFLIQKNIIDVIDKMIYQCSIDDKRRPNLLRIHSYLANK